jgi:hypothetical protein
MNDSVLLLVIVVGTALAFDFTNGFHDTPTRWRRPSRRAPCARASPSGSARC